MGLSGWKRKEQKNRFLGCGYERGKGRWFWDDKGGFFFFFLRGGISFYFSGFVILLEVLVFCLFAFDLFWVVFF
jgi:hypothetical protein